MTAPSFILPDRSAITSAAAGESSYAIYNYYGKGPIAAAKRKRFERALTLGAKSQADRVIDMGCADGLLLPSLSAAYKHVAAIDLYPEFIERSSRLVNALKLPNVQTLCSKGLSFADIREQIGGGYKLMYLLETLEHVGVQPDMWGTKLAFVRDCLTLLEPGGQIIITVPKMVGWVMLFKNLLQRSLGLGYDPLTMKQLLRSAILKKTDDLEPLWSGGHVGFNHLKLDKLLSAQFNVLERKESAISVFYRVGKKA